MAHRVMDLLKKNQSVVENNLQFSQKQKAFVENSFNGLNHASADYGTFFFQ